MYFINKILSDLKLAWICGADGGSKVKIIAAGFIFPLKRLLKLKRPQAIHIRLKMQGKEFSFYLTDGSDLAVLKEVFLDEEYKKASGQQPHIIFDIGSHVGSAALYFYILFPQAKIFAFEPDPITFEKLKRNVQQFPAIVPVHSALGNKDGMQEFFVYPGSSISSSLIKRQQSQSAVMVPTSTIESVMKKYSLSHLDFIKFDVEGAEYELLEKYVPHFKPKSLIGEVHLDLLSVPEEQFLKMFEGYTISKQVINDRRYILSATRL